MFADMIDGFGKCHDKVLRDLWPCFGGIACNNFRNIAFGTGRQVADHQAPPRASPVNFAK